MGETNTDKAIRLIRPGGPEELVVVDWPAELGQRLAYAGAPGAYASTRRLPAWRAVPLPGAISPRTAAASLLRGLTAQMLLTRTHPVRAGETVLVHAAAGGLGAILTRWVRHLGGNVIGTVGSEAKAQAARANGANHVIVGREADVVDEVAKLTNGRGVDFVVDGIGGAMLARSFACARRFGTVASVGQAAGPIPPVPVEAIGPSRSLTFARPSVMAYAAERETYPAAMGAVFAMIEAAIAAGDGPSYPLAEAACAQADLEAGRIAGSAVLLP